MKSVDQIAGVRMANVSVESSIIIFRDGDADADETPDIGGADYLWRREMAERAAAKKSPQLAARRIHQQLAQAYAERRGFRTGQPMNEGNK